MLKYLFRKLKQFNDLVYIRTKQDINVISTNEALTNCTDIYAGLSRLIAKKLPYILLDNKRQYRTMCLPDRWINGKPITNNQDSLVFDYEVEGRVYQIQSSPKKDGTALFFVVGEL